jgi:hypothetical protein
MTVNDRVSSATEEQDVAELSHQGNAGIRHLIGS